MSCDVSLVNTFIRGGAAVAALRLQDGLRKIGVKGQFVNDQSEDRSKGIVKGPRRGNTLAQRAMRKMAKFLGQANRYSLDLTDATQQKPRCDWYSDWLVDNPLDLNFLNESDVIHLHWVAGFIDVPSLFDRFAGRKPIVWTLHDMNAFTGGCHFSHECSGYSRQCGDCPMLIRSGPKDASSIIWKRKRKILDGLSKCDLHIVTPSEWLSREARNSPLLRQFNVTTIPYGLDTSLFRLFDENHAKDCVDLPREDFSLLFVSDSVATYRKGFDLLVEAIAIVSKQISDVSLLCVGSGEVPEQYEPGFKIVCLGHVSNARFMSIIYSAADLLVIPSRQDNLPNTVLESMACGTPVVGFNIGGMPDMVREGSTGWLASEVSAKGLAETILRAIQEIRSPGCTQIKCRELVQSEFTVELQAQRYKALYDELKSQL